MDSSPPLELDPDYVNKLLLVLAEHDVQEFEGGGIRVKFKKPTPVVEAVSTDVRGFNAASSDGDGDDTLDKLTKKVKAEMDNEKDLHRRMFGFRGQKMPTLAPDDKE
jgi:hypothetical protein